MARLLDARGILGAMTFDRAAAEPTEQELIELARRGDHCAFDRLVETHVQRVWRVVWRVLRHREDTEDVVQEVFLTAYRSLAEYRGDASLATWLHRIAVTRSLNHLDRSSEKVRRASQPVEHEVISVEPGIQRVPSPLQALEASELLRRLSECLTRLPAAWRAVLSLRDGEECSYGEIARALDVQIGTVRSRLARARVALRECIQGQTP